MVDMFSGSFVYNIPLLDVEGYPVNISYHGGVSMEQEASWVGLGWNINPGVINRTVRGIPDDFNGDVLKKELNIKPENTLRLGMTASAELGGVGGPLLNADFNAGSFINVSNYKGVSLDYAFGCGISLAGYVSAGVNMGVGSQTGASLDYDLSAKASRTLSKDHSSGIGLNASIGGGYSSRTAWKDVNFSAGLSLSKSRGTKTASGKMTTSADIPIGIVNFVPVITNSSTMRSVYGRVKLGVEFFAGYVNGDLSARFSRLTFENDASRAAYGYMYMQNAPLDDSGILDFTRDKDGMFNKSMKYLPVPNMAYDVYSLSGQGTGGVFRPFRNDFGNVYDPKTGSVSEGLSLMAEAGLGNLLEVGCDASATITDIRSGPWGDYARNGTSKGFKKRSNGSIYEDVYFKAGGELTEVDATYFDAIGGEQPITPDQAMALPATKPGSATKRDARGNLIYCHTALQAGVAGVGSDTNFYSYTDPTFTTYGNPTKRAIKRTGANEFQRKKDQVSEIVQVQKDGRKYVYGIPALNNVQREAMFTVDGTNPLNLAAGTIAFTGTDASTGNNKGTDHYYSSTTTPSFVHSYLLTAVQSNDYIDVTGNGVTDDDFGTFTKFNYTRTDSDYRWVAPYSSNFDSAQYSPGFWSDRLDDKANFVCGSREQWNLHSIETKNYIAEFYTSIRRDAQGIAKPIMSAGESALFGASKLSGGSVSYKLDSIKLYNKHDRYVNGASATPVKSVFFVYDYSLCGGSPNSTGGGKLTLQKIYFSYGRSAKSMISPYQFRYGYNPNYNFANKDRWGTYKRNKPSFTNYEFPYVDQNDTLNDTYAAAWSITTITLPSGGTIRARYECNDYAFVQDKAANEMFMVGGVGNSPNFIASQQLYSSRTSPCLYTYFKRRPGSEVPALSFAQNYLGKDYIPGTKTTTYFNFHIQLTSANNTFEQIKGYGNVIDAGICPNNTSYGYLKFEPVQPQGSGATLSPITFTALNTARYNLPQVIYPGQSPDENNFMNVLKGMKGAIGELLAMGKNPVVRMVDQGGGKNVKLAKCFIRLVSVGLHKKGGGQRVKSITYSDEWNTLSGDNEFTAEYGKRYSYVVNDPVYGQISSGVASYEPLIGGDENPFRTPVPYTAQSGSNWPPMDAVDLYQETPIGESLFPAGQVGYRYVEVASIHQTEGRSSKNIDRYEFYTAKEFPVQFAATAINSNSTYRYRFFSQENKLRATQGYTLIFNDMHGKPKKVEHDVFDVTQGIYKPVSYLVYNYKQKGNKLDNTVQCLFHEGTNMVVQTRRLGVEEDITLDTRHKRESTKQASLNANFNFFLIPTLIPIPVGMAFGFGWFSSSQNEFQSAVVAKVIQQYGILDNVESYNEGAKTVMSNEIFDPSTGQPLVTSITNEYQHKEYTTSIPASWAYTGMAGAYANIGYTDAGTISVNANYIGKLNITNTAPLIPGDELSVSYKDTGGAKRNTVVWVMGSLASGDGGGPHVVPRFPLSTIGWAPGLLLSDVRIRVISSGHKNMLDETVQTYTSNNSPVSGGALSTTLTGLIDIKARTFTDSNTRIVRDYLVNPNVINPYCIGERGQWRLLSEYAYQTNRNYSGTTTRNAGLFTAPSLFVPPVGSAYSFPYNFLGYNYSDSNWRAMRTITKWSPYGKEVENVDAIGNYSTAVFGFNEELPVAVAANAKQGDVLALGFEDYHLLRPIPDMTFFEYLPFYASVADIPFPSLQYKMSAVPTQVSTTTGHTGMQSFHSLHKQNYLPLPIRDTGYSMVTRKFNSYFSNSSAPYTFSSSNEYLQFSLVPGKSYILNYWFKPIAPETDATNYALAAETGVEINTPAGTNDYPVVRKSHIIDGWQQVEVRFTVPIDVLVAQVMMPENSYVDDLRIFPVEANMKAFVYAPINQHNKSTNGKLMATLDENNFATLYEYDQEGNLVRVKKETTKGIMTVSESRSGNHKAKP
ncbi:MAG: hypothetical protein V4649_02800 [Bacteroidota bacterium]